MDEIAFNFFENYQKFNALQILITLQLPRQTALELLAN